VLIFFLNEKEEVKLTMSFHHREPLHMEIMKEMQTEENMKSVPGHAKDNVLAAIVISRLFAVCVE